MGSQLIIIVKIERHGKKNTIRLEKLTTAAIKSTDQDCTQTGRCFLQQIVCYTHKW